MRLIAEKTRPLFRDWLAPLVNLQSTLLLFATLIYHRHYFGAAHEMAQLMALDALVPRVTYIYGGVVLLANLLNAPEDWREFRAFMVFIGSAWISLAYIAPFWMSPATPTWSELLVQGYYVVQALSAGVLLIVLLMQKPGSRFAVTPRLSGAPGALKTLLILGYVVGMTQLLARGFEVAPNAVTAQVNLYGALALELCRHALAASGGDYRVGGVRRRDQHLRS